MLNMKHKMETLLLIMMILMLSFNSVSPEEHQQAAKGNLQTDTPHATTEITQPVGEIPGPAPFPAGPNSSPLFKRIKKPEPEITVKRKKIDLPPVLSNDADVFWEVTGLPNRKSDFVDGNHPNNYEITTHDHVDQTIGQVPPTKRVKKILPPFERKRNVRNIGEETTATTMTTTTGGEKLLEEAPKRFTESLRDEIYSKSESWTTTKENLINKKVEELKNGEESIIKGKKNGGSENGTVANLSKKNVLKISTKKTKLASSNSKKPVGNVKKASGTRSEKEFSTEIPDTTPFPSTATVSTTEEDESNVRYLEPSLTRFLQDDNDVFPPLPVTTTEESDTTTDDGGEIQGIRLVPNEHDIARPEENEVRNEEMKDEYDGDEGGNDATLQKSIWDLLKEREHFVSVPDNESELETFGNESISTPLDDFSTEKPTPTSLYNHFDEDSSEVEYETENFKRGFSNIEKHELPLSYAMSWLQMKDKGFDVKKDKKDDGKNSSKGQNHTTNVTEDVSKLFEMSQDEKSESGVTVSVINSGSSDYVKYGHRPSKWYLLLLTGNSTIVKLRQNDFTKYLKLNLAARLSVEYDDVRVNKVILAPPKVLVNVSVFAPSVDVAEESQVDFKDKFADKGEAPLYKLAETNATLLELSGEEYHVVRFLSLESQKPKPEAHKLGTIDSSAVLSKVVDFEFVIYIFLGSACACAIILTLFITLNKYFRRVGDINWPWFRPGTIAWNVHEDNDSDRDEFNGVSPAVIYSGGFPQIRGSWMNGTGRENNRQENRGIQQRCPAIELKTTPPHRKTPSIYPDLEEQPCSSPRHSKLQIYNCDANSLVIPRSFQSRRVGKGKLISKSEGNDSHPLDVRIMGEKTGQDNPIFTN